MALPTHRNILELLVLTLSLSSCYASVLEFQRIRRASVGRRLIDPHATPDTLGTSGPGEGDNSIVNHEDVRYSTNITLGGKRYAVALDTGSTDLWVHPVDREAVGTFNDTGMPLELRYGDGSYGVRGTIATAPFQMGSFNVSQQAFLHVNYGTVSGLYELGLSGILGLSFDFTSASPLNSAVQAMHGLNATWGASPLKNIFDLDSSTPNFIALDLARTDDLEDIAGGSFAIGEYAEQWASVASAPKLQQYPKGGDRWTTVLQSILVDGNTVNLTSGNVGGIPGGGIATLLDTGAPADILPQAVTDGIYRRISGAVSFMEEGVQYWLVPCNTTAVVEFEFGGQRFPIHPLDLSAVYSPITVGGKQYTACIGTIQGVDDVGGNEFQAVSGDVFLKNVYSLYDFGDTLANGTTGEPYMQLLAQTNPSVAVSQVAAFRNRTMANLPPEIPPAELLDLLQAENSTTSDSSMCGSVCTPTPNRRSGLSTLEALEIRDGSNSQDSSNSVKRDPVVVSLLALNLVVGLAVLAFGILNYMRNGRLVRRPTRAGPHYVSVSAAARAPNLDSASMYAGSNQGGPFRGHYEELDGHSRSPSVTSNLVV